MICLRANETGTGVIAHGVAQHRCGREPYGRSVRRGESLSSSALSIAEHRGFELWIGQLELRLKRLGKL